MTAEIAVLNKFGVAMAADSAVTVETFHDNEFKTKVHNSANKLFTLSKFAPVAIMFYNTVTLGGMPWETIVKAYRHQLGETRFPKLSDYANDFFEYLKSNDLIFPPGTLDVIVFRNVARALLKLLQGVKAKQGFEERLARHIADLEKESSIDGFDDQYINTVYTKFLGDINSAIQAFVLPSYVSSNKRAITKYLKLTLQKKSRLDGYSGIVFSGFGEEEFFPKIEEYIVDLHLGDNVRCWRESDFSVSHSEQSEIIPFADTEVIRTLIDGLSPRFEQQASFSALTLILEIPKKVLEGVTELDDATRKKYLDAARKALPQQFKDYRGDLQKFRKKEYTDPIKSSISSLPISELGAVAEALLNTSQILKKVNPDLETVGGPVDVAVISKGDGFVWIKRKHYFDPALNHSFADRYLRQP